LQAAIQRGAGHTQGATGCRLTNPLSQLESGAHSFSSPIWIFGIGLPNEALEERGAKYVIRIPANDCLMRDIADSSGRPSGLQADRVVQRLSLQGRQLDDRTASSDKS
jgi:hypothetical protein